jgi:leucyl aminopeptidase (aminopeptidase T)
MTEPTQAQIEAAAKALHASYQWDVSKNETYWHQLANAALTAAAGVGAISLGSLQDEINKAYRLGFVLAKERCAQVADDYDKEYRGYPTVGAAIRALKDEPFR